MSHRRRKINAVIPKPNDNITMTMSTKVIVDAVFSDTGLDRFLDGLKRDQGESVANEVKALVANSVEMTGISVERLDRSMQNRDVREEYGLGYGASKSIYRTVERIGERSDDIVRFLGSRLKGSYGIGMDTIFVERNGEKRRVWSNFGPILRAFFGERTSIPVPKEPGQTSLDSFRWLRRAN